MILDSRYLIYLLLPLFCYGCMRTPGLPETPIPVTPDPCPIPERTAMIFFTNEVFNSLFSGSYGKATPAQSCDTVTGKNQWYNGNNPVQPPTGATGGAGTWQRTRQDENNNDVATCADPCICNAEGACYGVPDPNSRDPIISFYPYCPPPPDAVTPAPPCYMAVIIDAGVSGAIVLRNPPVPPAGAPTTYTSDGQLDEITFEKKPVDDQMAYLRAKTAGCNGCPVVVA